MVAPGSPKRSWLPLSWTGIPKEGDCEPHDIFETIHLENEVIIDLGYLPGKIFIDPLGDAEVDSNWFKYPRQEESGDNHQEKNVDSKEIGLAPSWEGEGSWGAPEEKSNKEEDWLDCRHGKRF
ncbi:hypothetical protein R1flu_027472 [Riccia fluitans]|uniref:Uncharacterized protein n=1 Tax=Riccia fluitans TaxID=41844 RepID=A0ABD1XIY3_9MARC